MAADAERPPRADLFADQGRTETARRRHRRLGPARVGDCAAPESGRVIAMWRQLTRGVRSLLNGGAADRHVDEELQHFIDEAAAAYEADGHAGGGRRTRRAPPRGQYAGRSRRGAGVGVGACGRNGRRRPALRPATAGGPSRLHVGHHRHARSRDRFRDGDAQRRGSRCWCRRCRSQRAIAFTPSGINPRVARASRWPSEPFVEVQERSRALESWRCRAYGSPR